MTTFKKIGKMPKYWSLSLEFQVSSLGLVIFDEVLVSKFQLDFGLEGFGLHYITT